ncbi:MAG: flagellar hook-length control protein FliK [Deltaproteobacteria bacterium]|jgi:flagellar hook-length control protein FliK|nr:flagellar hook-length control protein FliK [Deltaproteobacteria bacterium]
MNILPAIKLAASARNFLAGLASGAKNAAGASDKQKAADPSGAQNGANAAGAKKAPGFAGVLRQAQEERREAGNSTLSRDGNASAAANAGTRNIPALAADVQRGANLAAATPAQALADVQKGANLTAATPAPAPAGTRNALALAGARNIPALSDIQKEAHPAVGAPAQALAGARNSAPAARATQTPGLADTLRRTLEERQETVRARDTGAEAAVKKAPATAGARNIPALSDIQKDANPAAKVLAEARSSVPAARAAQTPGLADTLRRVREEGQETGNAVRAQDSGDNASLAAKLAPSLSGARHALSLAAARNTPNPAALKDSTGLAELLRQAGETHTPIRGRDDSRPSLGHKHGHDGLRQGASATHSGPQARIADAPSAPLSPGELRAAGNDDSRPDAPQQQYTPLEKAPATPHSINRVHYQLGEVGFTQRDLAKLRDKLLGEGLAPQSLTVLEQLASHPHGATLGQVLALVHDNLLQNAPLPPDDKLYLQYFADKIDGSGELGKTLTQLLENGRHREAWDALKSSLADLHIEDGIVFEAGDAALLCKVFGISAQTGEAILRSFGNADGVPLTPDIFTAFMQPAQQEILDKAQQNILLGQALAKHLQALITEARLRGEQERKAAEGADRKSKHTEILIRDRITDSFRKDLAAPEADEAGRSPLFTGNNTDKNSGKDSGRDEEKAGQASPHAARADRADRTEGRPAEAPQRPLSYEESLAVRDKNPAAAGEAPAPSPASAPAPAPAPGKPVASGQENAAHRAGGGEGQHDPRPAQGEQNGKGEHNQDTRRETRGESPLARVEFRPNAQASDAHAPSAFTLPAQPQEAVPGQLSAPAPLIRQALQQVEQGTLRKLADGGQRLELQLAPSELGAVTLILTSGKGGEISATIRSERSETAELVARHLDIIRVSLEEQGLKVDKLEVQNQMLNARDDWQGMEQHNAMRDGQERREQLERLRRLGRQGENGTPPARDVQLPAHTAEISGQGLHLVA